MLRQLRHSPIKFFFLSFFLINLFLHLIVEIPAVEGVRNHLFYSSQVAVLNHWHPKWYFEYDLKKPTRPGIEPEVTLYNYDKKEIKEYRRRLQMNANLPNLKFKRKVSFEAFFVWNVPLFLLWALVFSTPKISWKRKIVTFFISTYLVLVLIAMKITVMGDMKDDDSINTIWHRVSSLFGTVDAYLELFFLFPLIIWVLLCVDKNTFSKVTKESSTT